MTISIPLPPPVVLGYLLGAGSVLAVLGIHRAVRWLGEFELFPR